MTEKEIVILVIRDDKEFDRLCLKDYDYDDLQDLWGDLEDSIKLARFK